MMTRANDCADEREAEASRLLMLMTPPRGAHTAPGWRRSLPSTVPRGPPWGPAGEVHLTGAHCPAPKYRLRPARQPAGLFPGAASGALIRLRHASSSPSPV